MSERPGQDGLKCGDWEYDVLVTDTGNLMFTVYAPGTTGNDEDNKSVDIVVFRNMEISHTF